MIEFKEPDDYSIENPVVIIDDIEYTLYEGGSLSIVTPKSLYQTIKMLGIQNE